MPSPPIESMFTTLKSATHYVSTALGVASKGYSANRCPPLQGIGQGNGAGPAIWAVVSSVIFDVMYSRGLQVLLRSPITHSPLTFVGYAFVDDTDLVQMGHHATTPGESVASVMQQTLDTWEGSLRATGGALVPSKSHWYLVDYVWKSGQWHYRSKDSMLG